MGNRFLEIAGTPSVAAAQAANGSGALIARALAGERRSDRLTPAEAAFITNRDSFYLATVSETGWPYIQHRGGPPGFLRVLDDKTLAFADFRGNRQYISLGNIAANGRAALFLMDYAHRRRLKIYAHIARKELRDDPALTEMVTLPDYRGKPERIFVLEVEAFDWNCSQHITPRFSEAELAPLFARMQELEAENAALREQAAHVTGDLS
jgi:predicted pyridoxine 5'-phosphate oxidase superfamily flavin-nucleotide-binding protein